MDLVSNLFICRSFNLLDSIMLLAPLCIICVGELIY
jgi:hypothetical protein